MARGLGSLAVALGCVQLIGCIRTEECQPQPNGLNGQLVFGIEGSYDQAAGLSQTLWIPAP